VERSHTPQTTLDQQNPGFEFSLMKTAFLDDLVNSLGTRIALSRPTVNGPARGEDSSTVGFTRNHELIQK
jgi:hypothetical protein